MTVPNDFLSTTFADGEVVDETSLFERVLSPLNDLLDFVRANVAAAPNWQSASPFYNASFFSDYGGGFSAGEFTKIAGVVMFRGLMKFTGTWANNTTVLSGLPAGYKIIGSGTNGTTIGTIIAASSAATVVPVRVTADASGNLKLAAETSNTPATGSNFDLSQIVYVPNA